MKNQVYGLLLPLLLVTACSSKPHTIDTADELLAVLNHYSQSDSTLFGQHDATLYGHGWFNEPGRSDVSDMTGDYPAVLSFDLGRIEQACDSQIDCVPLDVVRREIIAHYNRGGIISLSWHCYHPIIGSNSWDTSCDSTVRALLPGRTYHDTLCVYLDRIAAFISTLHTQYTTIPVIFRPWHEMSGSWFWWGTTNCTSDEYIALYRFTHDYLTAKLSTQSRNLSKGNSPLIWCYSPNLDATDSIYAAYYPGDNYVDLLGFDVYDFNPETDDYLFNARYSLNVMQRFAQQHHKPMAFTETGLEGVRRADWFTQCLLPLMKEYPIAYALVWRNAYQKPTHFFAPYPGHEAEKDFIQFYNNEHTLFCRDLQ